MPRIKFTAFRAHFVSSVGHNSQTIGCHNDCSCNQSLDLRLVLIQNFHYLYQNMSSLVVNDVFDELTEENDRLTNELLWAKDCLKVMEEFKLFVELVFARLKCLSPNAFHKICEPSAYESYRRRIEELAQKRSNITTNKVTREPSLPPYQPNTCDSIVTMRIALSDKRSKTEDQSPVFKIRPEVRQKQDREESEQKSREVKALLKDQLSYIRGRAKNQKQIRQRLHNYGLRPENKRKSYFKPTRKYKSKPITYKITDQDKRTLAKNDKLIKIPYHRVGTIKRNNLIIIPIDGGRERPIKKYNADMTDIKSEIPELKWSANDEEDYIESGSGEQTKLLVKTTECLFSQCTKLFYNIEEMHKHLDDYHKLVKCPNCDNRFTNQDMLNRHLVKLHGIVVNQSNQVKPIQHGQMSHMFYTIINFVFTSFSDVPVAKPDVQSATNIHFLYYSAFLGNQTNK